jgi:hypothetical protein
MFSIEYGYRSDMTAAWKETVAKDLRKHALDTRSLEVRIANATTTIRHWTLLLEELAKKSDRVYDQSFSYALYSYISASILADKKDVRTAQLS